MTNKSRIETGVADVERTAEICRALSNPARLQILNSLVQRPAILTELAVQLGLPLSTLSGHVALLEQAGLISVTSLPGSHGKKKRCAPLVDSVLVEIIRQKPTANSAGCLYYYDMPVGNYFDYAVTAPCGIASPASFLAPDDDPAGFALPEHGQAGILWLTSGYLEYRFPLAKLAAQLEQVTRLEFTLEVCAETYGYDESWRSDLSVWINGTEMGYMECLGDYGQRRGRLNPKWWPQYATQYGELHQVAITAAGCSIDGRHTTNVPLHSLLAGKGDVVCFKIGVQPGARFAGGLNLFGASFGDHAHGIVLQAYGDEAGLP